MQGEDFSSVNVSFVTEEGCISPAALMKIISATGEVSYTRVCYTTGCEVIQQVDSSCRFVLNEAECGNLFSAVRKYEAECTALKYLERAEHSEKSLSVKLIKKGFSKEECKAALSYLSSNNYLNDKRFAESWLSVRLLCRNEGRVKLLSELVLRGVSFELAQNVLDNMFNEAEEKIVCRRALKIQKRKGLTSEKLILSMVRRGFPLKLIKECMKDF